MPFRNNPTSGFAHLIIVILIAIVGFGAIGYYAYKNGQIKAPLIENNQTPTLSLTATIQPTKTVLVTNKPETTDDRNSLTEYLKLQYYDQGKQYGKTMDKVVIKIDKLEGNYAMGTGGFTDGGGDVWYATKINGSWKIVDQGQEPPLCKTMNQYNFPKSMYEGCNEI